MDVAWSLMALILGRISSSCMAWEVEVCIEGVSFKITRDNCSNGFWFEKARTLDMLCGNGGMWAVYQKGKTRPKLWTPYPKRSGCASYSLIENVNGILCLGNGEGGAAIWKEDERNITLLSSAFVEKELEKYELFLGGDIDELSVLVWGQSQFGIMQKEVGGRSGRYGFRSQQTFNCLLKGNGTFFGEFRVPLRIRKNVAIQLEEDECNLEDTTNGWWSVNLLPRKSSLFELENPEAELHLPNEFICAPLRKSSHRSNTYKRNAGDETFDSGSPGKNILSLGSKTFSLKARRKIDEQSERLGRKFIGHVFNGDPLPEARLKEWELLMLGKEIFVLACPDDIVPESFFETMLIFFQLLLAESLDKFPPKYDVNQRGVDQIYNYLTVCYNNATPMEFIGHSSCVEEVPYQTPSMNFKGEGNKSEDVAVLLPVGMRSDVKRYDSILESIWKLVLFVHYYCAQFFGSMPHLLSSLYEKWQGLMAPDILLRWQYQGKSNLMVTTVVRNLNVTRVLRHVDECLAGAQLHSAYTAWLQRPFPPFKNVLV